MELRISYTIQGIIAIFYLATAIAIMYIGDINYPLFVIILGCCFFGCGTLLFLVIYLIESYVQKLNKELFNIRQRSIENEVERDWLLDRTNIMREILHIGQSGTWQNRVNQIIERLKTNEEKK